MGLSNVRRALVVDSNPWNRRQICDVLAKKGYEVSACDTLAEGKKFYRSHPIVVAAGSEDPGELEAFFGHVRASAGESGGYLIQTATELGEAVQNALDVNDVIGPALDPEILAATFEKADAWLGEQSVAAPETEIISSAPAGASQPVKTQPKADVDEEIHSGQGDGEAMGNGETPGEQAAVSIRRGSGRKRPGAGTDHSSKGGAMPDKTTKYQYNLLIENAPLAMAMFDKDMRYVIANALWRKHFDLVGTELIGRGHYDIFSEVSERWQKLCDRALGEDREVVGEEYVEWPDGATDWVRWTMRPWADKSGGSGGLVVSCGVITDEKGKRSDRQFESGLAESLMNSGVTPLVITDFDGRVLRCNRIAKRWGDWGEASGDDRFFWDAFVPVSERQGVHEAFHGHAVAMQEDGEFTFPPVSIESVHAGDGGERLVAWTNTPRLGEGGVITGLVRVGVEIRDGELPSQPVEGAIDEASVAELQDEWMDSFPLMCWRTNSRGKIKFFNRQWLDFRGRNALEECDNGWMDGLHEEDYDSLIHAFDTAAKTGARVNHVARVLGGDGQYRWLRFVSARDFSDLEGASDGFIGYCEDLARIIRLESELSAARSRYDELLEDSTGAFRAKRSLEEAVKGLEANLEDERQRLSDEREQALAELGDRLVTAEAERDRAVGELAAEAARLQEAQAAALAQLTEEKDGQLAELAQQRDDQLAEQAREKDAQLARAIEDKEVELGRVLKEKQDALAERDAAVAKELEEVAAQRAELEGNAKAKFEKLRDKARKEIAALRKELKVRVAALEKERDDNAVQHAEGLAALRADFDSAKAENEKLAAEQEGEKERQAARDAELVRLRKEADAAQKEAAAAGEKKDRFVTMPENAPFGMVLIDRDGSVLYSNPATDEITGGKFGEFEAVEDWLVAQAPTDEEAERERLLELWRDGIWRKEGVKVISMRASEGLRELELKSKLLAGGQVLLTLLDVTDTLRAEEALRASEVKFRSIFYDSGVGMALVDKTGNIFDANPAQEKLMGYSRAELRKMHIEDCLSLEEIARTQELAKEMAESRARSGELTIKLQPKDKRPAWAHMNVSLVRDPDGEVIFAAYFFHDITKEREAISKEQRATSNLESARSNLETAEAEKQAIVEASPDLIVVAGPDGTVENVVPPVSFPLHIDHSMEGRPIAEVIPPIADDFAQLVQAAQESGGIGTKEFSVKQEEETLYFECRVARSGARNTVVVIRDITVAKRAELAMRRQALTFASIHDAIIVADLKGRINDWNPAAESMFGYTRDEAVGKGLYVLYDRENPKRFKQTITTAIGKERKWEARTQFHRKDGSVGECEVRYSPLLDEGGRPVALVGVSRLADSVPGAAQQAAVETTGADAVGGQARLRRSVQSLAEVLALQEGGAELNEEARAELGISRARLESLALLNDTIEEGGDLERVDFGAYVRKLVQKLLGEFGPKHAGIEVHLNVKGIVLPVDVAQPLALILFELLSNSLRHAFHNSPSGMVGVSMGVGAEAGWMVVNDDGAGLPDGFDLAAPPQGSGLKIAAQQARQIHGDLKLVDAMDTEIQVGFRLNGAT